MNDHFYLRFTFSGTNKEAEARLNECRDEIAKAGGELVEGSATGYFTIKGFLTRWRIIQIMDGLGFNLTEVVTTVRGFPPGYFYQAAQSESQQEYFGK